MPTIKGWGRPSCIQRAVEKIRKNNRKARKANQIENHAPTPRLKHDKIQAPWASDVKSKNMLERV